MFSCSRVSRGIVNPLLSEGTPSNYILEDSNFDIRYVRLCDLDNPREKMLNYLQPTCCGI